MRITCVSRKEKVHEKSPISRASVLLVAGEESIPCIPLAYIYAYKYKADDFIRYCYNIALVGLLKGLAKLSHDDVTSALINQNQKPNKIFIVALNIQSGNLSLRKENNHSRLTTQRCLIL
jgi:hypothetical protein